MNVHTLVDAFVERVNASPLCFPELVPESEHITLVGENRKVLVESFEEKLPRCLPNSFRDLLYRYTFPPFDAAGVSFFAWSDDPEYTQDDLRHALFADEILSRVLLANGYVQFGRPDTGDYDAVCFDTNQNVGSNEYSIVRVEHENVLIRERIITHQIAPSLYEMMKYVVKK